MDISDSPDSIVLQGTNLSSSALQKYEIISGKLENQNCARFDDLDKYVTKDY